MRIFLDTANLEQIKQGVRWGLVTGVTTNPSLVLCEGVSDYKALVQPICAVVPGEVSAEVTVEGVEPIVKQAREIASWHKNVVVKIPVGADGYEATARLAKENIKVNMTLCFSANQALLAALAGAYFVSPFVGRLDDTGHDGMALIADIVDIFERYELKTKVLAASIRHPLHCTQAAQAGAHIATVPFKVLEQMMRHPLTDAGIARFMADWRKLSGTGPSCEKE
jgi:transaldolase